MEELKWCITFPPHRQPSKDLDKDRCRERLRRHLALRRPVAARLRGVSGPVRLVAFAGCGKLYRAHFGGIDARVCDKAQVFSIL